LGVLDIVAGLSDNRLGIVTGRAIREVKNSREGSENVEAAVASSLGPAHWSAAHDDDDSFFSVRVTASPADQPPDSRNPQWCVFYDLSPRAPYGLRTKNIIPGNRAAQIAAPNVGARLQPLPGGGPWACGALPHYYGVDKPANQKIPCEP
jgi:hypothetical protein